LKATNEVLQKKNDEIEGKESQVLAKVSDIRSKLALAEAENGRLKKELASRPMPQAGPSVDDRMTWRKEKAAMEAEIRALQKDVELRMKREEGVVREMEVLRGMQGENERLKLGWAVMTDQYAVLWDSFESEKKTWSEDMLSLESERRELSSRVLVLQDALHAESERTQDQQHHMRQLLAERDLLDEMVADLRTPGYESTSFHDPSFAGVESLAPILELSDMYSLLELTSTHNALVLEHGAEFEPHILSLTASVMGLEQSLREATYTLTTLEASHTRLEAEHADLRLEHAPCSLTISQLRYEADQACQTTLVREEELGEVRAEYLKLEDRYEKQIDMVAKAGENEARSKFALESLEEEIAQ